MRLATVHRHRGNRIGSLKRLLAQGMGWDRRARGLRGQGLLSEYWIQTSAASQAARAGSASVHFRTKDSIRARLTKTLRALVFCRPPPDAPRSVRPLFLPAPPGDGMRRAQRLEAGTKAVG